MRRRKWLTALTGSVCLLVMPVAVSCGGSASTPSEPQPDPDPDPPDPPPPHHLVFISQPDSVPLGGSAPQAFQVEIRDSTGTVVPDATNPVTLELESGPEDGQLRGIRSVAPDQGVASISGAWLDRRGLYRVRAVSSGLESAVSAEFEVTYLFSDLVAGRTHVCGRTTGGLLLCWGRGASRLPGSDPPSNSTPVALVEAADYDSVVVENRLTCGLIDGAAWCRGTGSRGQLGSGSFDDAVYPVPVVGGHSFAALSAGDTFACGRTSDGAAYCWGSNMAKLEGGEGPSAVPIEVPGDLAFTRIDAGSTQTCGITTAGDGYCWGLPGNLGNADWLQETWTPALIAGGHAWRSTSSGDYHACGIDTSNAVWCWGESNFYGQMGTGAAANRTEPEPVLGGLRFRQVSAGRHHSCGTTLDGTPWCWGSNEEGQLGIDDQTMLEAGQPIQVATELRFRKVLASNLFSCGLTETGEVWCWGENAFGQVGNGIETFGTSQIEWAPIRVVDPYLP